MEKEFIPYQQSLEHMKLTPKQEAKQLVGEYLNARMPFEFAKKCALISVNKILSVLNGYAWSPTQDYWIEVKKELENLKK